MTLRLKVHEITFPITSDLYLFQEFIRDLVAKT